MDKRFLKYDNYRMIKFKETEIKPIEKLDKGIENDSEQSRVEKLVFYTDKNRLPTNDLTLYLSDKCSPELRAYMEKNFLKPVENSNVDTEGLTDEEISFFGRGVNESRNAYVRRINDFMHNKMQKIKDDKQYNDFLKSLNGKS